MAQGNTTSAALTLSAPFGSSQSAYQLGSGDQLRIRFFDRYDRDDLNGEYVISESGQLRLPRIGVYEARNKSIAELEQEIRQSVENRGEKLGYFAIDIVRCRPFYVAGLANHPGSFPFVPGLTVLHAVSIAGGIYRSPMASVTEAMRERRTLSETSSRLVELVARRARLQAEQNDAQSLPMPRELAQLQPMQAAEIMESERSILQKSREVEIREKSALDNVITLTRSEAESYRVEIARLERRIEEQTKIFLELKKLHEQKVINQQRFFEAVTALDGVQRDKQTALAGLSRANTELEKAQHDFSMVTLAKNARIARDLTETEREISRLKTVATQTGQLISGLETLSSGDGTGRTVTYKIVRRDESGRLNFLPATETTPIMPGDVVQIDSRPEAESFLAN